MIRLHVIARSIKRGKELQTADSGADCRTTFLLASITRRGCCIETLDDLPSGRQTSTKPAKTASDPMRTLPRFWSHHVMEDIHRRYIYLTYSSSESRSIVFDETGIASSVSVSYSIGECLQQTS